MATWLQTEPYQPHSIHPLGGQAATGAQNSDPSPQILVVTRNNFVIDLADFGTQTEKVARRWTRATKVNIVKAFLPFLKFMKRPHTKFHVDTTSNSRAIRSKKPNLLLCQKFLQRSFFLFIDIY